MCIRDRVYGGISMGLGWALAEQMQFDKKTGRLQQDNLLDYKLPTAMDLSLIHI